MRPRGYFERVAHIAAVGLGPPRRSYDPRIDAVGIHLAAVHSMPLHRIVDLVAKAIARRARTGASAGHGKRGVQRRGRSHPTFVERARR
jgi:hypothetical protein